VGVKSESISAQRHRDQEKSEIEREIRTFNEQHDPRESQPTPFILLLFLPISVSLC
jgi:hypothetical protein